MTEEQESTSSGERCRHILSNGIFHNQGLPTGEDASTDGEYWCGQTQTMYGPDDQICDSQSCCDSSRDCYEVL